MPFTGTWLRHIPAGSDPLYRPPTPADGRWQRGATIEGIYLGAEEATVWAEWYRWLAELEIEPLRGLPRELWRYRASLSSVADLTSAETLASLGLPAVAPSRDQWPLFQDIGEQLHAAGCDGLLYHSAARPGGLALCVFRATVTASSGRLEPLTRARRVSHQRHRVGCGPDIRGADSARSPRLHGTAGSPAKSNHDADTSFAPQFGTQKWYPNLREAVPAPGPTLQIHCI